MRSNVIHNYYWHIVNIVSIYLVNDIIISCRQMYSPWTALILISNQPHRIAHLDSFRIDGLEGFVINSEFFQRTPAFSLILDSSAY